MTQLSVEHASRGHEFAHSKMPLSAWSWSVYEGGRDPYIILISVYVFIPYFVTRVVGDPVNGQALVAFYSMMAGLGAACLAPLIGAIVDITGRRKRWLLTVTALVAPLIAALWWVTPDSRLFTPPFALTIVATIGVFYSITETLHNSLLHQAAGYRFSGKASGWGLTLGALAGVAALCGVLIAFALPGHTTLPFVPDAPLFGLDTSTFETERIVAPIAATLLVIGAVPLALFVSEKPQAVVPLHRAVRLGGSALGGLVREVWHDRNALRFLLSRVLYADGTLAMVMFLGIFAAGVMGWGVTELLIFGISQSVFSALGGFAGGRLDDYLGPKTAAQLAIGGMITATIAITGMAPDRIAFVFNFHGSPPILWDGPILTSAPDLAFLFIGAGIAFFATSSASSSRTLLVHLAPPERSSGYFGLYALAGRATVWLGPLLVEIFTRHFDSQQAGFAPIAVLMLAGLIGLFFVRAPIRPKDV